MVTKNMQPQPIKRDFYGELSRVTWRPILYGQYNKLDDEGFIIFVENMTKKKYDIDDFECCSFELSDREKFLITMHNKEYLKNIKLLISKLENIIGVKVHIDYVKGMIQVIKLKNITFE